MIRPDQIITLILFMAALGVIWLYVRQNRAGLARRIAGARRLQVAEVASLSPTDRAMILRVDGQDYLIIRCKGLAPLLHPLPCTPTPAPVSAPAFDQILEQVQA